MSQRSVGLWLALALIAAFLSAGCGPPVVPPELMKQVDQGLTLTQVRDNPQANLNKMVLWGGRIIHTVNKTKGTLIEVLQIPLDSQDRPKAGYESSGRFIVAMPGFLDPEIYHKNREVTVVGQVVGVEMLPVGEVKYKYALLRGKEVKLWEKRPDVVRVYPAGGFYGGFGGPMWGPVGPGPYPYWFNGPYGYW
ncbi:MAG: Slp family lipoprotein [Proteobacteria bacterium]|nr:Slp family lipoprotein [Pseudomonadota bacterium]MBU1451759.1 Slp family lipoprotein [Pseudomonadota bacterium]MBU2468164.1 Slp family lipoprotein [Pseudomonadota bacterium]MBU2516961.1 Slp family lipoprotein [Pseudomonadota bacterium]